jgi:hypothetical protein
MSLRSTLLMLAAAMVACDGGSDTDPTDTDTDTADTDTSDPCPGGVIEVSGEIVTDTTWTADCPVLLKGGVFVGDDTNATVLTIEPGARVYGESASSAFLVVRRGSRIEADGTAAAPIVFTSDQPEGSRARGNWGGVILNGRAPINACAAGTVGCEAEGEGGTGLYGGDDADDNSGTLRYVRIEYGGTEISADNEINGLTLAGVGSGTTLDFVQIHSNLDDGVEFFGGTAEVKHLVVSCPGDDGIDWDLGWTGRLQFGLVTQCDDAGNNGIEADNNEADFSATPGSSPVVSNLTLVGNPAIAEDNLGILLRRGTAGQVWNSIATGFSLACLGIRDAETYGHAADSSLAFAHDRFACDAAFETGDDGDVSQEDVVFAAGTDNDAGADVGVATGYVEGDPDYRPAAGSDAATGGMAPSGAFFDAASYIGAFDPAGADWTDGWTNFARD